MLWVCQGTSAEAVPVAWHVGGYKQLRDTQEGSLRKPSPLTPDATILTIL